MSTSVTGRDENESVREAWVNQIKAALSVNGGEDDPTRLDYIMHFLSFFWKVLLSSIPPPHWLKGYPCFLASLLAIGVLTAIIGDLAGIFGSLVNLSSYVTGIYFLCFKVKKK